MILRAWCYNFDSGVDHSYMLWLFRSYSLMMVALSPSGSRTGRSLLPDMFEMLPARACRHCRIQILPVTCCTSHVPAGKLGRRLSAAGNKWLYVSGSG
jgi:hypothetical protein